jgi:hypothetical protein
MLDLLKYTGKSVFGSAYNVMLNNDTHAPGSVDHKLMDTAIKLCPDTVEYLYSFFTPLRVTYKKGSRIVLEQIIESIRPKDFILEQMISAVVEYTSQLYKKASVNFNDIIFGGTEESIIKRGSDWCTDLSRVACILYQVVGCSSRIVYLFDTDHAYSGHAIIELYIYGNWGAIDPTAGIQYMKPDGTTASVWDLMNNAELFKQIEGHTNYCNPAQFRAASVANYSISDHDQYDYSESHLNTYMKSVLEESEKGWPSGLKWIHGEEK